MLQLRQQVQALPAWQPQRTSDTADEIRGSTLLEEFKNSKTRRFELSDIAGHVVEFRCFPNLTICFQQFLLAICALWPSLCDEDQRLTVQLYTCTFLHSSDMLV